MFNIMDKIMRRNFDQIYDIHTDVVSDRKKCNGTCF